MNYKKEQERKQEQKLQKILKEMPSYCADYFMYCSGTKGESTATMLQYANNLNVFFYWMFISNPSIPSVKDISMENLNMLTPKDIQEFMFFLRNYEDADGSTITNSAESRANKLSALRSFFQYFFAYGGMDSNPAKLIESPKIKAKRLSHLEKDELDSLLDSAETGIGLTKKQQDYAKNTYMRDAAIIALLSGTGIRVSELVGIDLEDIDWKNKSIHITRKGGKEDVVYFGEEVRRYLNDYIEFERKTVESSVHALFLSSRHGVYDRLSVRSVQRIVKKYSRPSVPTKNVTPHTLRRTFGTGYYNSTGDLYLTADVLGHKNVQVTAEHYSSISDTRKRQAGEYSDKLLE